MNESYGGVSEENEENHKRLGQKRQPTYPPEQAEVAFITPQLYSSPHNFKQLMLFLFLLMIMEKCLTSKFKIT
jgi:hypothetical protein